MASSGIQTRIGASRKPAMIAREARQRQTTFVSGRFTRINVDRGKSAANSTLTASYFRNDNARRYETLSISAAWISPAARNRLFRPWEVGTSGDGRNLASR